MKQGECSLRTALYRMLSFQFHSSPGKEDVDRMAACEEMARSEGCDDIARQLAGLVRLVRETTKETLVQDYHDLLTVPGGKYTAPYESVYVDEPLETPRGRSPRTFGPSTQTVMELYRRIGLRIDRGYTELPDYIGLELAAMEYLCVCEDRIAGAGSPVEESRRLDEFQDLLLRKHLVLWIPAFADRMRGKADTDYYRGLAEITRAWITEDADALARRICA